MSRLDVTMLGGFSLAVDGVPLPPIPSRLARSLVAYLLLNRDRPHRREHLVGLFWPDMPASRARRRLSHTLWQVQDVLGELALQRDLVVATTDTVAIDPDAPIDLDVETFVDEVERFRPERRGSRLHDLRALDRAVDRYQGELLAGHDEDWVEVDRQRVAQLHLDALGWLVGMAKGEGAYEDALIYARRITLHDPVREDAHREVMRLCTLLGRTSEALRQFERCRSVLLEELDTGPSRETLQLATFVERQRDEARLPTSATLPPRWREQRLVGRDRERAVLIDAMERTLSGRTTQVTIEGEAGVGKSRLVDQVVEDARWRDLTVLRGVAEEGGRPYAAIVDAVSSELTPVRIAQLRGRLDDVWRREAARVLPSLDDGVTLPPLDGAEARERLVEATTQVALAVMELSPSILVVEDLQHADDETLAVLDRLATRLQGRPCGLVVTCRRAEVRDREAVWQTLRRLDGMTVPDRIALGPLSPSETSQVVRDVLPGVVPLRLATRVHDETGGNPLFVVETLRAILAEGTEDLDELATLPLPTSIQDLVTRRLAALDEVERDVVTSAAFLGGRIDLPMLAAATASGSESGVGGAVGRLLRDGLFRSDGQHLSFAHDQMRRVVVSLTAEDGQMRHRIAEALAVHRPERIDDIADHLDASGDVAAAVRAHRRAGRAALDVHAFGRARVRLARAAELQTTQVHSTTDRVELLREYEDVLAVLGLRDEQLQVLEELLRLTAGADGAADALRRRAWHAAQTDDYDTAIELGQQSLELAENDRERGLAMAIVGTARLWRGEVVRSVELLERATAVLEGVDEGHARATLGDARRRADQLDQAVAEFERAIALARQAKDVQLEVRTLGNLAAAQLAQHELDAAERALHAGINLSREIGSRRTEGVALVNLAGVRQMRGRPGMALRLLDEAQQAMGDVDDERVAAHVRVNRASLLHHVLGRDDEAVAEAEAAMRYFAELGDAATLALCQETLASIDLRRGRPDEADRRLADLPSALDGWTRAQLLPTRVLVALRRGELARAQRLVAAPEVGTTASGLAVAAEVALAAGDLGIAGRRAAEAVTMVGDGDLEAVLQVRWTAVTVARATGEDPTAHVRAAADHLGRVLEDLGPEARAAAEQVPLHRDVLRAAAEMLPVTVEVDLAPVEAPIGRGAAATAKRSVRLELRTADDADGRRRVLLDVVAQARAQGGDPTVADLAELLAVSSATVRRDLARLRDEGHEVRTRGFRAS